jgi:hypothetical protein
MELALNVAWFILAAASYLFLDLRHLNSDAHDARGPSRVQRLIALTCALAILFPVISLTDDLHEMQATMEEPSASCVVIKRAGVKSSSTPGRALDQLLSIIWLFAVSDQTVAVGSVPPQRIGRPSPCRQLCPPGRAPPSFILSNIS